ncbi:MAG: S8 family serine peptidase [Pseudomonadales bacterium]
MHARISPFEFIVAAALAIVLAALTGCGGGSSGTSSPAASAAANLAPTARLDISISDGFAPLDVGLDGSASSDDDGNIASYTWTFGDGATASAGPNVVHRFARPGTYEVVLQVRDDDGAAGTARQTVRVRGATLSGVIGITPDSRSDSDLNDRLSAPVANDEFGSAQALPNPVRLGGFVNQPATGSANGNFYASGDVDDYFRVSLGAGDRIVLAIADPDADLDLWLYTASGVPTVVDFSVSLETTEDLLVSASGDYFVRVQSVSGASNYALSIAPAAAAASTRAKRGTDPFVPSELLLLPATARAASPPPPARVHRYAIEGAADRQKFRLEATDDGPTFASDLQLASFVMPAGSRMSPALLTKYQTLRIAKALCRDPALDLVEVNALRRPLLTPNDPLYADQWHYQAISLPQAWDVSTGRDTGNPDAIVAVVDTGVLLDHPDLAASILRDDAGNVIGADFIQDPGRAGDGDGIDLDPSDPGDEAYGPGDGSFHGTHVAGTAAAASDNGVGVAGVSWGARIMPLRALGIDGGTTFDVMQAIRYAAGLDNLTGRTPPRRADVINLSLGSDFYSEAEQRVIDEARAAGVLLVASAGNDASSAPSFPAAYDGVISVSATTIGDESAPYSNRGATVDVAAPGGLAIGSGRYAILSTDGRGGGAQPISFNYEWLQGTSMAAPQVSGVIALMKSVFPELTPGQFDALLAAGELTDDLGPPGRDDEFGYGRINAYKALTAALGLAGSSNGDIGPVLASSTGTLNFQSFTSELSFSVANVGTGTVQVATTVDQPWLSVTPLEVDGQGLGSFAARADRSGLADGSYSATIRIAASDPAVNELTIRAQLQVTSPAPDADAGPHYVVLLDETGQSVGLAQPVSALNGQYHFELTDVAPGTYRLFAGTDADDDDTLCDGGEACGAWPSLTAPEALDVDARVTEHVDGLQIFSELRTTASTTARRPPATRAGN